MALRSEGLTPVNAASYPEPMFAARAIAGLYYRPL
ncbi:hypothetical protein GGR11_000267 [Brevundimonas mediterranea]|uniref:Uncharacterized protein n=1 Tax=Brevundimonas mediterranea TaxID=74329 RepID=A0A7W6A028_9CAUL|nr:hypothetical protein [Brevundimonas mediterranea]